MGNSIPVFLIRKVFVDGAVRYWNDIFNDIEEARQEKNRFPHSYSWDIVKLDGEDMIVVERHQCPAG